jgi:hypothetical protein
MLFHDLLEEIREPLSHTQVQNRAVYEQIIMWFLIVSFE